MSASIPLTHQMGAMMALGLRIEVDGTDGIQGCQQVCERICALALCSASTARRGSPVRFNTGGAGSCGAAVAVSANRHRLAPVLDGAVRHSACRRNRGSRRIGSGVVIHAGTSCLLGVAGDS